MYTKFVSKAIQERLKEKERALAWEVSSVNQVGSKGVTSADITNRSVFLRMCSNKSDVPNILISGGEYKDGQMQFGSSMYQLGKSGLKPLAGIKDVSSEYKGGFKAIRETTVNWTIHSIEDLDRLTPYFLTLGKTVVVDWGWTYSKSKSLTDQLGSPPFITKDNNFEFQVNQEIFTNPTELILKKGGDYDAVGGQVSSFNYTLREDGGFDCVTKITSMGAAILQKPINSNTNKLNIINKKDSDGKSTSIYTPPDSLINAAINLRDIIMYEVFGVTAPNSKLSDYEIRFGGTTAQKEKNHQDIFATSGPTTTTGWIYRDPNSIWTPKKTAGQFGIAVDNRDAPNIILSVQPGAKEDIFVTWAWFEDFFLSRYTSLIGGKDDKSADAAKLTFRSIDTVLDEDGIPIRWSEYKDLLASDSVDFSTEDFLDDTYGDEIKKIAENWDIGELTDVVKTPSLIRNVPLLYPQDPFKFFMTDTVIKDTDIGNFASDGGAVAWFADLFNFKWYSGKDDEDESEAYGYQKEHKKFINQLFGGFGTFGSPLRKFKDIKKPEKRGRLRNIFVNIKEIQKAFGISNPESNDKSDTNVKPTGTVERAVTILLSSLNDNFHNLWDFDITVDTFDSTNIKIVDKSIDEIDDPVYTSYQPNSHIVQTKGIYQFPSYKIGSFVKNQSLEFKVNNAQSLTTMYGSNTGKGSSFGETNNPSLTKLFSNDTDGVFNDKFLVDAKPIYIDAQEIEKDREKQLIFKSVRVGSKEVNQNSKIKIGTDGIVIDAMKSWWKEWTPGVSSDDVKKAKDDEAGGTEKKKPIEKFVVKKQGGKEVLFFVTEETAGSGIFSGGTTIPFYLFNDLDPENKRGTIGLVKDAAYALDTYFNAATPLAQFDMNSLIPAELGLEIDGVGGLLPGDIIHTDYIQERYKTEISTFTYTGKLLASPDPESAGIRETTPVINRGPLTYFQVFGITQKITSDGWSTELQTKMRINAFPKGEEIDFDKIPKNTPTKALEKSPAPVTYPPQNEVPDPILKKKAIPPQKLRRAKQITIPPENVDSPFDPSVPLIPIELMSEEDFNNPKLLGKTLNGNDTDVNYTVPEPGEARFPGFGIKYELGNSGNRFALNRSATSTLPATPVEIETKTYIAADPAPPKLQPVIKTVVQATTAYTDTAEVRYWEAPTLVVQEVKKAIEIEPKLSESIPVTILNPIEVAILQSTYDPSIGGKNHPNPNLRDYKLNPTFQLIYKIVPGWYTKSKDNPKNTSFYGEDPTSAVLKKYRQKFWDEVIEAPNDNGVTELNTAEKIKERLDEIGDAYKDLGPYDTWTPITGIPYAMYPSYNENKNGVKSQLPTAP